MSNCGASSESCCTSLEVTGGTYYRTYTNNGDGGTGELDPATVSNFRLDKYEVTVGRYRQFVAAYATGSWTNTVTAGSGKHTHLNGGKGLVNSQSAGTYESGWNASDDVNVAPTPINLQCSQDHTWTATPGANENLPINCVNWYEAYAFCIWDGGFLPSVAEWEYAAGGGQEREYPWGSTPLGTACPGTGCSYAIYDCKYPAGAASCSGLANIAPVGTATLGAGPYGQLDLAGNMAELNLDWETPYVTPCTDCAYLGGPPLSFRSDRGGSYVDPASYLVTPGRDGRSPISRGHDFGFRCARTP